MGPPLQMNYTHFEILIFHLEAGHVLQWNSCHLQILKFKFACLIIKISSMFFERMASKNWDSLDSLIFGIQDLTYKLASFKDVRIVDQESSFGRFSVDLTKAFDSLDQEATTSQIWNSFLWFFINWNNYYLRNRHTLEKLDKVSKAFSIFYSLLSKWWMKRKSPTYEWCVFNKLLSRRFWLTFVIPKLS